jgi:hypothetical protein
LSAYVARLIARAHGHLPLAQPRLPSRFEPARGVADVGGLFAGAHTAPETAAALRGTAAPAPDAFTPASASGAPVPNGDRGAISPGRLPLLQPAELIERSATALRPAAPVANLAERPATNLKPSAVPVPSAAAANLTVPGAALTGARPTAALPGSVTPVLARTLSPVLSADTAAIRGPATIHVSIGRVDVRAILPEAARPARQAPPSPPRRSLDDYLARGRR